MRFQCYLNLNSTNLQVIQQNHNMQKNFYNLSCRIATMKDISSQYFFICDFQFISDLGFTTLNFII